ncbi:glycosyl hydrolase 108 family protein [Salinarimonas sp.]|uniref:glycoside hydrolase family 108 protein n=1 Tax=Salinarimonas sp. TaxID=2766526 RepID=UPI0032D921A6
MNPLITLALQFAPDVARAFAGDKGGRVAASVTDAVAQAAGTSDAAAAQIALAQDPAKLADLRIRLAQIAADAETQRRANELDELKAQIADTENARATFAELAKSGNVVGWAPVIVSIIVVTGFFVILAWLIVREPGLTGDSSVLQLVNITIGALTAAFATVVNFWLGSSHGSRIKDQLSAALQAQSAASGAGRTAAALGAHSARIDAAVDALNARTSQAPAPVPPPRPADLAPPPAAPTTAAQPPTASDADARFERSVTLVLELEGGYVDNPADPGGATNMGITLDTLRAWRHDPSLTAQDVKTLTEAEAKQIYRANYWDVMRCDDLPAGVDLSVFDFGVNAGPSRSVKLLQQLVGATQDGIMGPNTLAAVATKQPVPLIESFADGRLDYYKSLSTYSTFGRGWTNRTERVEQEALSMAGA